MEFKIGRLPGSASYCTFLLGLSFVGMAAPAAAQITAYAYVPNANSDNVTVIQTISGTVVGSPIAVGLSPLGTAASPDGSRVYVTNFDANTVMVIDVAAGTVSAPIAVGMEPFGLAVTPNGLKVYVANFSSNTVSVLDTGTNTVVATIPVGGAPAGVSVSPDGQRVYVANNGTDNMSIVDTVTDTVVGLPIAMGNEAGGIAVSPNGQRVYVANFGAASVSVYDVGLGTVVATIPVGNNPAGIAVSPDGSQVAVANQTSNSVTLIDTATNTAGTPLAVPGFPGGVSYTPDGETIYVTRRNDGKVSLIDVASSTVSGTDIAVGSNPFGIGLFMTPPILTTACTGCGAQSIASDADLTPLGVGSHVIFNSGVLLLNGNWTTSRNVSLLASGGTIQTQAFAATISGKIVNSGALTKLGSGTLTLSGSGTHTAGTTAKEGTFLVNGTHTSPITLEGATLGGTGTVGNIVANIGTVDPGVSGPGILHAANATFAPGTQVVMQINGPAAGLGFDQLDVSGTTTLNTPTLSVQLGYTPAPAQLFVIMPHATGTFAGLVENAFVDAGGGMRLRLTYQALGAPNVGLIFDTPPTVDGLTDQTLFVPATLPPIAFTVGDDITPAATLGVTATSSNPAVLTNANLVLGGSGANRTLTATPEAGVLGTTTITVTVSDGFQTTVRQFTLTVKERTYNLAEGATGSFFSTDILLANPNTAAAPIVVTFFKDDHTTVVQNMTLAATSRTTIRVGEIAGLEAAAFSTTVTSPTGLPLIVERTMTWDATGYGAHAEKASPDAALQWFFAEGSQGFFHTYFLLLNPSTTDTVAHVTYFLEGSPAVQRDYPVAATSRLTIDAANEPALRDSSFGARVVFDHPGMAERAMYFGEAPIYNGGHASAGVNAPSPTWFLAEGATGTYFNTFVLITNPNDTAATVNVTYLPDNGVPIPKTHVIAGRQRLTINIATEDPALESAAVSTQINADQPVIAERAQYWPVVAWHETHNSAGEIAAGTKWGLAEGRVGGTNNAQTYILVANPGSAVANVTATFLRTNGTTIVKTFAVQPTSRFNIAVTGPGSHVPELADESFGTVIESTQPVIIERSVYTDVGGVIWAAGTNATGTRLP